MGTVARWALLEMSQFLLSRCEKHGDTTKGEHWFFNCHMPIDFFGVLSPGGDPGLWQEVRAWKATCDRATCCKGCRRMSQDNQSQVEVLWTAYWGPLDPPDFCFWLYSFPQFVIPLPELRIERGMLKVACPKGQEMVPSNPLAGDTLEGLSWWRSLFATCP